MNTELLDEIGTVVSSSVDSYPVFNAACANNRDVTVLSATYNLSFSIEATGISNMNWYFEAGAKLFIENNAQCSAFFIHDGCNDWLIDGVEIDGNIANNAVYGHWSPPNGITIFNNCSNITVDHAYIHHVAMFGFTAWADTGGSVINCGIQNSKVLYVGANCISLGNDVQAIITETDLFAINNEVGFCSDVGITTYGYNNTITDNVIHDYWDGPVAWAWSYWGIGVEGGHGHTIENNTITNFPRAIAIELAGGGGTSFIQNNTISHVGFGIVITSPGNTVAGNTITDFNVMSIDYSGAHGVVVATPQDWQQAIAVNGAGNNQIDDNTITSTNSTSSRAIAVINANGTRITNNTVDVPRLAVNYFAIQVQGVAQNTVIEKNVLKGYMGIVLDGSGVYLTLVDNNDLRGVNANGVGGMIVNNGALSTTSYSNLGIDLQYVVTITSVGAGTATPSSGIHPIVPNQYWYANGAQFTVTATPNTDAEFIKFTVGSNTYTTPTITVTADGDKTVTATFSNLDIYYSLTVGPNILLNPAGGSYLAGTVVSATPLPPTGSTFSNWVFDGVSAGSSVPLTVPMNADHTLQANFALIVNYTLTIGSNITLNPSGGNYLAGTVVQATATPPQGSIFSNWILDGTSIGSSNPVSVTMNSNHTLEAVFTAIVTYTLTIQTNVAGGPSGSQTVTAGTVLQILAPPVANYNFDHWTLDGANVGNQNPIYVTMNADHTLVAIYVPIVTTVSLTVTAGIGGSVAPSGVQTLTVGQSYQFNAVEGVGYNFDHWDLSGENKGSSPSIILNVTANMDGKTLTALFTTEPPPQITLTLAVAGNGSTDIASGLHQFNVGDVVTITAIPQSGAIFVGWQLDNVNYSMDNPLHLTVTADLNGKTLTADFTAPTQAGFPWWALVVVVPVTLIGGYALKRNGKKKPRR